MTKIETGERYAQSPITGTIYLLTKWEDRGDGQLVAHEKTEVDVADVPDEKVCEYCASNLAVEWSDQGKRQCRECSP